MKGKDILLVLVQLILFIAFFSFTPATSPAGLLIQTLGFLLVVTGLFITGMALFRLGRFISPFPSPRSGSNLITSGIFKWIRHPIYSGMVLMMTGISIYNLNVAQLTIAAITFGFFWLKSLYEERQLTRNFPEYEAYRNKTGRFIPKFTIKTGKSLH